MSNVYNFFGRIFDYLRETYWEAPFGYYRNFDLNNGFLTMGQIVFLLAAAGIAAAVVMYIEKNIVGSLVHRLLAAEASDEEHAKTLGELGLSRNFFVKWALRRRDSALRRVTRYVGEEVRDENGALRPPRDIIDYQNARFYIPEALRGRAEVRFSREGSGKGALAVAVLFFVVFAFVLIRILPTVIGWLDALLSLFA